MAVQKSKKSRSRGGMRRSHDRVRVPVLSTDKQTGEIHIRHNMTATGFYRGKQIVPSKMIPEDQTEEDNKIAE
jgi:large subunit ribosomal protein L32